MAKFDLSSVLTGAAALDTGAETGRDILKYINHEDIFTDERNFYSLDGIDELAANIQLCGLQQPLRVRLCDNDIDGRFYRIVSGHRRFAALNKLIEAGEHDGQIPCIVEQDEISPELQELRLIYANSDTRKMTSWDISQQAQRVEALLYALSEQGYEFPGRMRDHVAEACNVSRTKLARLKAIDNRLSPELHKYYETGKLNESTAYELSQLDRDRQELIFSAVTNNGNAMGYLNSSGLSSAKDALANIEALQCSEMPGACCHEAGKIKCRLTSYNYSCPRTCCKDCSNLATCKFSCALCSTVKEQVRAENKEAALRREEQRRKEEEPDVEYLNFMYRKLGRAMEVEDVSAEDVVRALASYDYSDSYYKTEADKLRDRIANGVKRANDETPFGWVLPLEKCKALARLEKLLQFDLGYLIDPEA